MASQSTCSAEAQHAISWHLKQLQLDFIKLMKDEDQRNDMKHYAMYIADIKFLLDNHIADLATHAPKDVQKQIIETVKDLSCKYLHPQESETESSDEDFPESFTRPVKEQIFSEFPKGVLTDEIKTHIENAIDYMEQLHTAAANALKELKKTTPVIPHGPFRLLLQALCQPVIKLQGHHVRQVKREAPEGHTILCMLLSPTASVNLPTSVKTLVAALMYLMKTTLGIDTSITSTAKIFDVLEKRLRQGLKGVKYESSSQRKRQKSHEDDAQAESSSSRSSEDEGTFAKLTPLKKSKKT